jgi:hypothetical protein
MSSKLMRCMFLALSVVLLSGCEQAAPAYVPEFAGTWVYTPAGYTDTLVLKGDTFQDTHAGSLSNGQIVMRIDWYDESADHIQATVVSTTGTAFTGLSGTYYIVYGIFGNQLYWMPNAGSYQADPTPATLSSYIGPFTKQ